MFCNSEFWEYNGVWNTTNPDFSECFQKTVLLWLPCAYIMLFAPVRILLLRNTEHHIIPWSWKTRIKFVLAFVISLVFILNIGKAIHGHFSSEAVPVVDFISPLIVIFAMIVYCMVVHIERRNGVRSSGFLFNFWFSFLIVAIVIFRSKIRGVYIEGEVEDVFTFVTFFLFFPAIAAQLFVACFVDRHAVGAVPLGAEHPCPEHHVSYLSQVTFWWFTGLVVQGYKRALVHTDLWSVNPEDKCKNVYPLFERQWLKEVNRCKKCPTLALQAKCAKKCEDHTEDHTSTPATADANDADANDADTKGADVEMKPLNQPPDVTVKPAKTKTKKSSPRLFLALTKAFGGKCLMAALFKLIFDLLQFVSPLILKYLIGYTIDKSEFTWHGYFYAAMMLVVAIAQSLVLHQYFLICSVVGMRLRTAIIAAVYDKMLKLSNTARKTSTVGEIVNLMSVDAQRFNDLMTYVNIIWSGPVQIVISIYFLWVTLGPSILAGVAVMVLMIPVNAVIANKQKVYQVKQMQLKDTRIKMMNEILNGIKVLKLYAWEPSFEKRVLDIRNKELQILKKMSYLNAATTFTWTVAPFCVCLITFAVYVMVDINNVLDAEKAFVSLALFNILRFPLSMVPQVISNIVQVNVSLKRLRNFLGNEELDPNAVNFDDSSSSGCRIENGDFSWEEDGSTTLRNINLNIEEGSLVAVVGTVGSGKSSLLQALLGEMLKVNGAVSIKGSLAYVAQQAWIQNATVQDNITFGKDADLSKYRRVIDACALQPDLDIMPAGDKTEIGEKGINLSGGQKQRVSLARAVFQDTDVYLLDDPLSAVDSHVGKHIFQHVIGPDGMLSGKTRILVTHGIGFLPQVDNIVVLVDGQVSEIGSYQELLSHDGAFAKFLKAYITEELDKEGGSEELEAAGDIVSQLGSVLNANENAALQRQVSVLSERIRTMSESTSPPGTPDKTRKMNLPGTPTGSHPGTPLGSPNTNRNARNITDDRGSKGSLTGSKGSRHSLSASQRSLSGVKVIAGSQKSLDKKSGGAGEEEKLIQAEKMETQRVKLSVFGAYLKSVGLFLSCLTVSFYILYNIANIYSNIWLSEWSNDATKYNATDTAQRDLRLGVYGALGLVQGAFILLACLGIFLGNVRAGRILHARLLRNIIHSPMSFFDCTPIGRMINRFSKDIDVMDTLLAINYQAFIVCFLKVITVPIMIGYTTPVFFTVMIPLFVIYILVQFFDETPRGRVLNRASEDILDVDNVLPFTLRSMINVILKTVGMLGVIAATVRWFVAVIPLLAVVYFFIQENESRYDINEYPFELNIKL